jgi:hypothetical protein
MLSFQIADEGKSIQIDCDKVGLAALISELQRLQEDDSGHVHLRAPSVGGSLLSDKTPWGKAAAGEVVISLGGED